MSAATELDWEWAPEYQPVPAGPTRPQRLASVTTLHSPPERAVTPQVRLTPRGVRVVAAAVAVVAVALVALAKASAPAPSAAVHRTPDTVTVQAGDTLWSIADRVAPAADPRAEVTVLQRLNHLSGVTLEPGQVLRTH